MGTSKSSQKFIGRNRPPRVQIEYDVELYGSEKKVNLPFVTGVVSDLSGSGGEGLPAPGERSFQAIDVDNFDDRLKSMKPAVTMRVPNTMTGEGEIPIDLHFESPDDFSPAAVARRDDGLKDLLEAREQLANLLSYMDGKTNAEDRIGKVLKDPALLESLTGGAKPAADGDA